MTGNRDLDIERREVDIGVRNRRPTHPWLAGRRTGNIEQAAYATSKTITSWIGPGDDNATLPSEVWTITHHGARLTAISDDPAIRMVLARGGAGRVVLPTFADDNVPELVRVSDVVKALASEQWLVCHQDTRHDPAIRAAFDALAQGLRHTHPLHETGQGPTLVAP